MVFSERSRWVDRWMEKEEIEDFAYWNNTDRPAEVSAKEWAARGKIWDDILRANPAGTPGMSGLSAQCTDRMLRAGLEDVLECIPPFDDRVAARARECAMDSVYAAMKESGRLEEDDNPFSVLLKIERWLGGEGSHVLEDERSRVARLLRRQIDAETLTSALPTAPEHPAPVTAADAGGSVSGSSEPRKHIWEDGGE
jgi:hypothetical protein